MKKLLFIPVLALSAALGVSAQEVNTQVDTASAPKILTLEQALRIAVSENASVKLADMEVERSGYERKGTYASLFPQVDGSAAYQRTIKKQVMYMDFDMSAMGGGSGSGSSEGSASGGGSGASSASSSDGFEVGRWNTWSAGVSASMPLVNAQLWESIRISAESVELAVEKARSSRLETVNQVKQAYFSCLLAKQAFEVYKSVYHNALENLRQTERKYNAQRASDLDLARAKSTLAGAVPNVYDAESSVILSLWQLKAVMGVSLDENIDIAGSLEDYGDSMLYDFAQSEGLSLENNSTLRQLGIQAEQLAATVRMREYAYLPSLALAFSYSLNAMTNDFKFSEYRWSPYSYVGLSLQVPIFSGGKRLNDVRQAKVQKAELAVQREESERQLRISIRQYLNQMETAMKSKGSAESALESARKAYDIASRSYEVGRSTLTELNDAQLALTQARLTYSQAIYKFVSAKASLEGVLGADFIDEDGNVQLNKTYNNE